MRRKYSVAFFVDHQENIPVFEYLFDQKNEKDLNVLINVIQRLAFVGQDLLDTNMAKPIEGPLFELRKDRHRIFYAKFGPRFVLLSAFLKNTQKTPQREIQIAMDYYQEYTETGNCQEFNFPSL
jgi:phage-related protein